MLELGNLSKEPDGYKVVLNRRLPFPVAAVWDAITNPKKLAIWFMETEFDFREGGKVAIKFPDKAQTVTYGQITRIEKERLFEFFWEDELVRWELEQEEPSHCRLTLTHSRISKDYVPSAPAGWHILLDQLAEMLNGRNDPFPFSEEETDAQKQMKKLYGELLANL